MIQEMEPPIKPRKGTLGHLAYPLIADIWPLELEGKVSVLVYQVCDDLLGKPQDPNMPRNRNSLQKI